jgi:hypothetical protein
MSRGFGFGADAYIYAHHLFPDACCARSRQRRGRARRCAGERRTGNL